MVEGVPKTFKVFLRVAVRREVAIRILACACHSSNQGGLMGEETQSDKGKDSDCEGSAGC